MSQQNGVQYVQLSNGMVVAQPQTQQQIPVTQQVSAMAQQQPKSVSSANQHHYSSIQDASNSKLQSAKPVVQTETDSSKSKSAQRAQLNLSQDAGLKCSQI